MTTSRSKKRPGRRRPGTAALLALVLLSSSVTVVSAGLPASAAENDLGLSAVIKDHGITGSTTNVRTGEAGVLSDGTPVVYAFSDGNPVTFNVLDGNSGALVDSFPIAPKTVGGSIAVAEDGVAYVTARDGSSSLIYAYDPVAGAIDFLAESPTGDAVVRTLVYGDDGMLYGSTYPNARVFSLDPATAAVVDYGSVVTDDNYAWGLEQKGDTIYVGTGIGAGHVMTVDIPTGTIGELTLPADADAALTYFYDFEEVGDLIAMAFSPGIPGGTNTLFWNTVTEEWVCQGAIPRSVNLNYPFTASTADDRMYYKSQGEVGEFDSATCETTSTDWAASGLGDTGSHRLLDVVTLGSGASAEDVLFGVNNDGSFWRYEPASGDDTVFPNVIAGSPNTAHAVVEGGDGDIFVSHYLGPGTFGRFDRSTGAFTQVAGAGQADSFLTVGDDLVVGSYPGGNVHRGDLTQPWEWGTNPVPMYHLMSDQQDRVLALASDGDRLAIGTVSDYGVSGGALTIANVDGSGAPSIHRDPIDKQSVVSVLWGSDGLVYAGTSRRGGLSSTDSTQDAHLLVFDPATDDFVYTGIPVASNDGVVGLAEHGAKVWGLTNGGELFSFDKTTRTTSAVIDLGTGQSSSPWGLASTLIAHPDDGLLYGIAGGDIFAFDPVSEQFQFLTEVGDIKRMTIAKDGTIFAINETNLLEVSIS